MRETVLLYASSYLCRKIDRFFMLQEKEEMSRREGGDGGGGMKEEKEGGERNGMGRRRRISVGFFHFRSGSLMEANTSHPRNSFNTF